MTQLYLVQKSLGGTIPADLGSLSRLTGLYLHRNELIGPDTAPAGRAFEPGSPDAAPQSARPAKYLLSWVI